MGDHEITAAAAAIRLEAAAKGIGDQSRADNRRRHRRRWWHGRETRNQSQGPDFTRTQACRFGPPRLSLEVNDSLRYTAVLDFERYWERSAELVSALRGQGYVVDDLTGWKAARYQGMNLTLRDSDGFEFELQFHTTESLRASDETHAWYEEIRERSTSPVRLAQLRRLIDDRYAVVPRPPGVPMVD